MKVKFVPIDKEFEISSDESVLELAQRENIPIHSVCNGMPSCAECRVNIVEGDAFVLSPTQKELDLIGSGHFVDRRRLACQMRCFGDVVVDIADQLDKQEERQHKRPQGYVKRKQTETSYAVTGNLIDQDEEFTQTSDDISPDEEERKVKAKTKSFSRNKKSAESSQSNSKPSQKKKPSSENKNRRGKGSHQKKKPFKKRFNNSQGNKKKSGSASGQKSSDKKRSPTAKNNRKT